MKNFVNKELIIYGPTATSKTALAIKLAKKYNGELICADSRQVYKGLDIGTGKVSFESKVEKHKGFWVVDGVKIHGFDLVNPGERFSVADFIKSASTSLIRISEVKKLPIIVGGTGFYIKALIDGIGSIGVPVDPKLRRQLEKLSADQLYQKLIKLDSSRAKSMNESDRKNPRRLIRAIEIVHAYLTPGVSQVTPKRTPGVSLAKVKSIKINGEYLIIGLTAPNSYLYSRADKWLDTRLAHGLIDEVKRLLDQKVSPQWLNNLGLEYRWISRYLKKEVDYNQMFERLKGDIHSFVRRQKTWFNKFKDIKLFDISKPNWQEQIDSHGHNPWSSLSPLRTKEAKASPTARSRSSLARNRKND